MNRKQFFILLGLVIVIGAAGLLLYRNNASSWTGGGDGAGRKLLPDLPLNDIAQITIQSGGNEVNLVRQDNLWRVRERANYPANFQQISQTLMKLADLKAVQSVEAGPSQYGRLELLPPGAAPDTGTALALKDQNGKTDGSLLLGKKHLRKGAGNPQLAGMGDDSWPDGRYVLTPAKTVVLISDPLEDVQAKPQPWLSKDFLNVDKPCKIAVKFLEATNSWTLTRESETNEWQLAEAHAGEKLDESKISSVTSPFSSGSFEDVAVRSSGNSVSNTVLTVETFDGFTYVAQVGPKQDNNFPVSFAITASLPPVRATGRDEKADDKAKLDKEFQTRQKTLADKLAREQAFTNWLYSVPAYSLEEILKSRTQLLVEPGTNSMAAAADSKPQ